MPEYCSSNAATAAATTAKVHHPTRFGPQCPTARISALLPSCSSGTKGLLEYTVFSLEKNAAREGSAQGPKRAFAG